jgi:arylsulfatase A-like enzyme
VVIVTGDHSDVAGERVSPEMNDMPHDPSEWTGAVIAGPRSLVGPPRVETFPSSHVDLMPTLLDLVGDRDPVVGMGTNLFADVPPGERTAVSVSGRGYRLDRGGWSLFVMRDHADGVWTLPIGAPLPELRSGVDGSPFTQEDARRLRRAFDTWSWLIEQNRVWPAHPR